jgi:two-component system, OmpR family, osmolarity sensor histidine kinase EnvZ
MKPEPRTLYFRFNRFIEKYLPHELYRRSLLILLVPIILIQLITAGIVLDRHWDQMTKVLGRGLSNEIDLVVSLYNKSDKSPEAVKEILSLVKDRLKLEMTVERGAELPTKIVVPFYSLFDTKMNQYLATRLSLPFWVDGNAPGNKVEVRIEVEKGLIFKFLASEERAYAAGTPWLLALMLLSTLLFTAIAVLFLRNQIRPILELARAAHAFGLGRDDRSFSPRGAAEVRLAGQAVLDMKRRIARHVDQRTAMLAGVSHDLRTILTRFRLELAVLGDNPMSKPLKEDVDEMQRMLEDYLNFVRGDGDEKTSPVKIDDAVTAAIDTANRDSNKIKLGKLPGMTLQLKANAFRRLLANILSNATRYAGHVNVTADLKDERFWLYVDDDGPGIPMAKRDDAFRPFVRLDEARNMDETGTGLGLAIALDIAHAHGGDINLEDSPMGGLRVAIKIPV